VGVGVPDPFSCNSGVCIADGVIPVTKTECPERCPEGTVPATACLECGVVDACVLTRTGCLPRCDDPGDCAAPLQCDPQDHVCRMACL
jgi:hypothetical protein